LGNHTYKYDFGPIEHVINGHIVTTSDRKNLRGLIEPRCIPIVFNRVEKLIAAGQLDSALTGCRQILQVDPTHAGALAIKAQFDDQSGKAAAIKQAGELIRDGKVTQVQQLLEPLAKAEVDNFTVRYLLGLAQLLAKNHAAARVNLQAAVGLNPEIAAAHNNLGCCQLALGELAAALVSFERAISLDPEYTQAQNNRDQAAEALERSR
jgi:tetratricopeptide (TPR) repeat protein